MTLPLQTLASATWKSQFQCKDKGKVKHLLVWIHWQVLLPHFSGGTQHQHSPPNVRCFPRLLSLSTAFASSISGVLSFHSVEFPQLFQLFHFHLGIANRKKKQNKTMPLLLTVAQRQTSFLCSVIVPLFFSGKIQPGGRPKRQGLTGERSKGRRHSSTAISLRNQCVLQDDELKQLALLV